MRSTHLDLKALLAGSDDTEPVTELAALEVLLGEVLEVALGEGDRRGDPDLALALARYLDDVAKLACLALYLDAVVQELLEAGSIENTVRGGAGEVL